MRCTHLDQIVFAEPPDRGRGLEMLHLPDAGQTIVTLSAERGSETETALTLLASWTA